MCINLVELPCNRHKSLANREHSFEYEEKRYCSLKKVKPSKRRSLIQELKRKEIQLQTYEDKFGELKEHFDEDYFDFEFERKAHSDTDLKEIDLENKGQL